MIDMNNIRVILSDAMRQRIAQGLVPLNEAQAIQKVKDLVDQVCGANVDLSLRQGMLEELKNGLIDAGAVVQYDYVQMNAGHSSPEPHFEMPLVSMVISQCPPVQGDEFIIEELVKQSTPNAMAEDGIPAFAYAFWRVNNDHFHFPDAWNACCQDERMDIERSFSVAMDVSMGMGRAEWLRAEGSLLNVLCAHKVALETAHQSRNLEQGIPLLLSKGTILDPKWMGLAELKWVHDYPDEWNGLWMRLQDAIARQDVAALQKAIDDSAVAKGFSLGHGTQLCAPEFWGPYLEQGVAAMLNLPSWVQAQLAPDLNRLLMAVVPDNMVQDWTHIGGVDAAQGVRKA